MLSPFEQKIRAEHPTAVISVKKLTEAQIVAAVDGGASLEEYGSIVMAEIDFQNLLLLAGGHTHSMHPDGRRPLTLADAYEMGKKVNRNALTLMKIEKEDRLQKRKLKKKKAEKIKNS